MEIKANNLSKTFYLKSGIGKTVLKDITHTFNQDKIHFIVGPSGSGKTTLLSILGLLDAPTSGTILFDGKQVDNVRDYLDKHVSYVFQEYNLFEDLTVYDNLFIYEQDKKLLEKLLEQFNCDFSLNIKVKYLSGGERQRLSILRAYLKGGDILLLDEPTGNLDLENSIKIMDLVKVISKDKVVIVVSHDLNIGQQYADEIIFLKDGKIDQVVDNNKTLKLDFTNEGKSCLSVLYEYIYSYGEVNIQINDSFITLNKSNYITICDNLFLDYGNQILSIKILKREIDDFSCREHKAIEKTNKAPFLNKYSFKNIMSKVGRTVGTFITLFLSCLLVFIDLNALFYDVGYYLQKNLLASEKVFDTVNTQINYSPVVQGAYLHGLTSKISNYYPTLNTRILSTTGQNQYPFKIYFCKTDTIYVGNKMIDVPNEGVLVTDCISSFVTELTEIPVNDYISLPVSEGLIPIKEVFGNSVEPDKYLFGVASYSNFVDMLTDHFLNGSLSYTSLTPQRFFEKAPYLIQANMFSDDRILYGENITNINEVLVDQNYYQRILENDGVDVLGLTCNVQQLSSFEENEFKDAKLDLFSIFPSVKIVGVIKSDPENRETLLLHPEAYGKIIEQFYINNMYSSINIHDNVASVCNWLYKNKVNLSDDECTSIYTMGDVFIKQGIALVTTFLFIMLTIAGFIIVLWVINIIKDKYREIAIMKSLGIKTKEIHISFLKMILIVSIFSLFIGLIGGVIGTNLIESGIISAFRNFSLVSIFTFNVLSFVIPVLFMLVFPVLVSLLFIKRIHSINTFDALKEFR